MTDSLTKEQRSRNMSRIRSSGTKPERAIRKTLRHLRELFRGQVNLPGKPDFWLPRRNLAVFVNGCFWHRHKGCSRCSMPLSNTAYWRKKFLSNISRDRRVRAQLVSAGIRSLVIWECWTNDRVKVIKLLVRKFK